MELWNRIKENDVKALEMAFNKFYGSLCLSSNQIVNSEEIAQEIVSDLFLKIWEKRQYIQITHCLSSYLYRSVQNASLDYLKSSQSVERRGWIEINEKINMIVGDNEEYILNKLALADVEKDVYAAINQLPKQCKEVFCLSRFESLTYMEIANRLNISVNTVKTQICRALDFLRDHLKDYIKLIIIAFLFLFYR